MMRCAKPARFFVFGSAAIFLIVLFSQLTTNRSELSGWVPTASDLTSGISNRIGRGSLKTVMQTSEKLWQKTVDQRREFRKTFPQLDFFPARDGPSYFTTPISVWDLVPASYNCPWEVERIGIMGDGGKWVCGMSRYEKVTKPCIIYSFGVQNESSFEQEMLERTNCEVWGYDFSVGGFSNQLKPEMLHRTHFMQAGISGNTEAEKTPPFYTIQDLMKKNGHSYIDILKIDIEYAEFNALSSLNGYSQSEQTDFPIGQMLIELHLFKREGITYSIFLDWWESMEFRGMRPTWTEPNLLAISLGLEDGQPRLAEYTMVNVKDRNNKLFR